MRAALLELDAVASCELLSGLVSQQHLAGLGRPRHPRGEVDRGAEPVAVASHRRTGVHPHSHRGRAVEGEFVSDPYPQSDGVDRFVNPDHHFVADRLHLLRPEPRQHLADPAVEFRCDLDRRLVTMCLGQRGEAARSAKTKVLVLIS